MSKTKEQGNELVIVDSNTSLIADLDIKEYGLEMVQAVGIQQSFSSSAMKYKALQPIYERIISSEITPELVEEAKDLKNKYVKVRTGIDRIHKAEKSYYLAVGKFIDATKNVLQIPEKLKEDDLNEIINREANLEKERLIKLQADREVELSVYVDDPEGRDLSSMDVDVWESFVLMHKARYEKRVAEEKVEEEARLVEEKKQEVLNSRTLEIAKFGIHAEGQPSLDTTPEDWKVIIDKSKENLKAKEEEDAAVKAENEKLKAAQAKRDAEIKKLSEEQSKLVSQQIATRTTRNLELGEAKSFAEFEGDIIELTEKDFKAVVTKAKAEFKVVQDAKDKLAKAEAEEARLLKEKEALLKSSEANQIKSWVESFTIPSSTVDNDTTKEIKKKFEGFKTWAKGLTE